MANYIRQPQFNLPSQGQQLIEHKVEIFEEATSAALQGAINTFLDGLPANPETPQIMSIEYLYNPGTWSALVYYVVIG